MTDREAQDLIRMIESNWRFDLGPARAMWREQLLPFDAEVATRALVRLARTMHNQPRLVDVLEVIRIMAPTPEPAPVITEDVRHIGIPTWVYVWSWARFHRDPPLSYDTRFPQEEWDPEQEAPAHVLEAHGRERTFLSQKNYEELHQEWIEAGAPRRDPLKEMTVGLGS